jgi:hypothetical protein
MTRVFDAEDALVPYPESSSLLIGKDFSFPPLTLRE